MAVDEQEILAAARTYAEQLVAPYPVSTVRKTSGPVSLKDGSDAWLVEVDAGPLRYLVSVSVGADHEPVFGHMEIKP
jgi:hypothetical protein